MTRHATPLAVAAIAAGVVATAPAGNIELHPTLKFNAVRSTVVG